MLKRNELLELVKQADIESRSCNFDLYRCKKASYRFAYIKDTRCVILYSYNTAVAVYSAATGTVYAFDGYSATTIKHIYKFCKMSNASRLIKLYIDTTNEYQVNFGNCGRRIGAFREAKQTLKELQARDFEGVIESFTKH